MEWGSGGWLSKQHHQLGVESGLSALLYYYIIHHYRRHVSLSCPTQALICLYSAAISGNSFRFETPPHFKIDQRHADVGIIDDL